MGWLISPFTDLEYNDLYRYNKETNNNNKITTPLDAVIYAGIYLTGRALKWFKPYLIEY